MAQWVPIKKEDSSIQDSPSGKAAHMGTVGDKNIT